MNTVDEPAPAFSPNSPDYVYWRAPALFVLRGEQASGKYDVCLDRWQPIALHTAIGQPIVDIDSGVFFGWTSPATARATFLFFDFASSSWRSLAVDGYPVAAEGASVYAGKSLVWWGGISQRSVPYDVVTNTGATYDLKTNRWTPMSTVGVPAARVVAGNVVSIGDKMFVWGGQRVPFPSQPVMQGDPVAVALMKAPGLVCPDGSAEDCVFGDGALYDPVANTWTAVSGSGAPAARSDHVTAWTGSRVLVWGGNRYAIKSGDSSPTFGFLSDGGLYDPTTDRWTPTAAIPWHKPYSAQRTSWSGKRLHVYDENAPTDPGFDYDPAQDRWEVATPATKPPVRNDGPSYPSVVWTGKEWLEWGGYRLGPTPPNPCGSQPPGFGCDPPGPMEIPTNEGAVFVQSP